MYLFSVTICCTGNLLTMSYTLAFVLISVAAQFFRRASAPSMKFNFSSLFPIYFFDGGFFGFASQFPDCLSKMNPHNSKSNGNFGGEGKAIVEAV